MTTRALEKAGSKTAGMMIFVSFRSSVSDIHILVFFLKEKFYGRGIRKVVFGTL